MELMRIHLGDVKEEKYMDIGHVPQDDSAQDYVTNGRYGTRDHGTNLVEGSAGDDTRTLQERRHLRTDARIWLIGNSFDIDLDIDLNER